MTKACLACFGTQCGRAEGLFTSANCRVMLIRYIVATALLISPLCAQTNVQPAQRPYILGVAHVAFRVSDFGRTGAFYKNSLGFAEPLSVAEEGGKAAVSLVKVNDEQYVELLQGDARSQGQFDHFALYTPDLAAMREYLLAQRVPLLRDVHEGRVGNPFLTIRDPDGHPLEIVQYSPTSLTGQSKGKLMPAERISSHITHVAILVRSVAPAMKFYRDILGFREISRGGRDPRQLGWIDLQAPEGSDVVELVPFTGVPSIADMKAGNHFCLVSSDVRKTVATLQARAGTSFGAHMSAQTGGGLPPRVDLFDPDGARIEIMEPLSAEKSAPAATPYR